MATDYSFASDHKDRLFLPQEPVSHGADSHGGMAEGSRIHFLMNMATPMIDKYTFLKHSGV